MWLLELGVRGLAHVRLSNCPLLPMSSPRVCRLKHWLKVRLVLAGPNLKVPNTKLGASCFRQCQNSMASGGVKLASRTAKLAWLGEAADYRHVKVNA